MKKDLLIEAAIYVSCLSLVSLLLQEPVVARSPGFVLASNTSFGFMSQSMKGFYLCPRRLAQYAFRLS